MARLMVIVGILAVGIFTAFHAAAEDRVASLGDSSPAPVETVATAVYSKLIDIVHALDKATHSSTKIIVQPFARSLKETAAGHADFHIPFIQNGDSKAPEGLAYVTEVDFGNAQLIIYSRKTSPLDANNLAGAKNIETESGHEAFFPFPVSVTHCVPCSLDKVLLGRSDALIVSADVVDPLLSNPKHKGIHRALYKTFPIRALVPANKDSFSTRRYLIEGVKQLKETGELWKIIQSNLPYSDWQP
jgi:hypothetical protein